MADLNFSSINYNGPGQLNFQGINGAGNPIQQNLQPLNWNKLPVPGTAPVNPVASTGTSAASTSKKPYYTERLFAPLPRSAASITDPNSYVGQDSRGEIAYMKLLTSNTSKITAARSKIDSLSKDVTDLVDTPSGYRSFFITDMSSSYNEQMQIHKTFGDGEVVYFFGKQPLVFNFSGLLFDSLTEDWFTKFVNIYSTYLRGTKLAQNYELVNLILPNMRLKGYLTNMSFAQKSGNDVAIPFNFQVMVKEIVPTPTNQSAGNIAKLKWKMLSWAAGKTGVTNFYTPAALQNTGSKTWGVGGYQSPPTGNLSGIFGQAGTSALASATSVGNQIGAFNSQLFSPVYGIISSITNVVASVTGDATKILTAITNPAFGILQSVTNVANQATALVSLVEGSAVSLLAIPGRGIKDLKTMLNSLNGAAGAISNLPEDLSQMTQRLIRSASLSSQSAILKASHNKPQQLQAVLSSGPVYTPANAYTL